MSSRSSVDRAPARCSGGHGFDSCRALRLFLGPTLVSCWSAHFSQKTSSSRMTLSCKSAINQTSLVHSCPSSSPRVQANNNSSSKGKVIIDSYQDYFTRTLIHCFFFLYLFILLSIVDEDEKDTEIRIVKRVEDYYPEKKIHYQVQ